MARQLNALLKISVLSVISSLSIAGEVSILSANFLNSGADQWSINVTLKHADSGWDHFANSWRVVDENGTVLGERVLLHPHVDEQPFTRSHSMQIPTGTTVVFIEANDKKHGLSSQRLKVDLSTAKNGRLTVSQ